MTFEILFVLMGGQASNPLVAVYPTSVSCPSFYPPTGGFMTTTGHGGGARAVAHPGIDIQAPPGTEALAISDGVVRRFGPNKNAGMNLWVEFYRDFTGLNRDVIARYSHIEVDAGIRRLPSVRRGQVLGKIAPYPGHGVHHLHIEFRTDSKIIDPLRVFLGDFEMPVEKLSSKDLKIPYLTNKGNLHPQNSKIIWPLNCKE